MPEEMSIDLVDLQEILKLLPDTPPGGEKRTNALTQSDVLIIAKIVQAMSHTSCAMGLTPEEIGRLKTALSIVNKSILGIGWLIIAAIVGGLMKATWWGIQHGLLLDAVKK